MVAPEEADAEVPEQEQSLERRTLVKDIFVLDFFQLQTWLKREGLSTQGDINEFRRRLIEYYDLPQQEVDRAQVTEESDIQAFIESAAEGSYFDIEEINEQYIALRGGVRMRLVDHAENTTHTIEAEELIFNQQQEIMTARGEVRYTIEHPDSTEEFSGKTLIFEIDDWQGFFFEGSGTAPSEEAGGVDYRYKGDLISRSAEGVVVMEKATITSSPSEEPYYRLQASKIWIIGAGEWAMQDATLYVGDIPLFYFPYFFRPGDEIVFHPVFGTQTRNGAFIQTTTYLRGRKEPAEDRFSFLQTRSTENNQQYLDGIFLRPSSEPLTAEQLNSADALKLIVDYYSRLGAYVALEGNFSNLGIISPFTFNVALSYSNHLYRSAGIDQYTSLYADDGTARSFPVYSNLFGLSLPIRYLIDTQFSIAAGGFQTAVTFQWYSDRYITRDFEERSEENDWYGIILGEEEFIQDTTGSTQDSFVWRTSSSYALNNIVLAPYLSTLSFDNVVFLVDWDSRIIRSSLLQDYILDADISPQRYFFYPSAIVAPDLRMTISGTLLSPEILARSPPSITGEGAEIIEDARPPWQNTQRDQDDAATEETDEERDEGIALRQLEKREDAAGYRVRTPLNYSLAYTLRPTLDIQFNTDNQRWERPEDVDFAIEYSTLTTDNNLQLNYMVDLYERYLTLNGNINTNARYRTLLTTDALEETEETSLRNNAYQYNYLEVSNSNTLSSHFLQEYRPWENSNLTYTLALPLYRYRYKELDASGNPVYESLPAALDEDSVTTHNTRLLFALQALSAQQSLTLSYRIPPLDQRFGAALSLVFGPLQLSSNFSAQEVDDEWELDLFTNNATLTVTDDISLSANTSTNLEEGYVDTLSTVLRTWFLSTTFTARHVRDVEFDRDFVSAGASNPWQEIGERALRPTFLTFAVNENLDPQPLWKNRIRYSVNFNSTVRWDWQRYTNSFFSLGLGFTLFIFEFLDLSISSSIRNDQIYLYFDGLARDIGVAPRGFFQDILDSVNIFDENQRQEGLFKIQNIRIEATHHLADWDLIMSYTASPLLVTSGNTPRFEWDQMITISVAWRAITELRRDITIDRDDNVTIE